LGVVARAQLFREDKPPCYTLNSLSRPFVQDVKRCLISSKLSELVYEYLLSVQIYSDNLPGVKNGKIYTPT